MYEDGVEIMYVTPHIQPIFVPDDDDDEGECDGVPRFKLEFVYDHLHVMFACICLQFWPVNYNLGRLQKQK